MIIIFSQLKSKQTSYWPRTVFFLSLPVEKESTKFSSLKRYRNIIPNSQNMIQDDKRKTTNIVLNIIKTGHFLGPPTQSFCLHNISTVPKEKKNIFSFFWKVSVFVSFEGCWIRIGIKEKPRIEFLLDHVIAINTGGHQSQCTNYHKNFGGFQAEKIGAFFHGIQVRYFWQGLTFGFGIFITFTEKGNKNKIKKFYSTYRCNYFFFFSYLRSRSPGSVLGLGGSGGTVVIK